jgi:hypothetical protein
VLTTKFFIVRPIGGSAVRVRIQRNGHDQFRPGFAVDANTTYEVVCLQVVSRCCGNGLAHRLFIPVSTGNLDTNSIADLLARWPFDNNTTTYPATPHGATLNGADFATNRIEALTPWHWTARTTTSAVVSCH